MFITNHVAPTLVMDHLENQLSCCWVQNKRLVKDLFRINLHEGTTLRMPQVIQVFLSTYFSTLNALPSIFVLVGVNDPNPPAQGAKIKKISKQKSKTTSGVSQKAPVAKTTKSHHVGSEHVDNSGEGIGENQQTLKNNSGESVINQPNHVVSSQKDVNINKETNTLLSTSSQKDLGIEKNSQPGAQHIGGGGGVI